MSLKQHQQQNSTTYHSNNTNTIQTYHSNNNNNTNMNRLRTRLRPRNRVRCENELHERVHKLVQSHLVSLGNRSERTRLGSFPSGGGISSVHGVLCVPDSYVHSGTKDVAHDSCDGGNDVFVLSPRPCSNSCSVIFTSCALSR